MLILNSRKEEKQDGQKEEDGLKKKWKKTNESKEHLPQT